MRSSIVYSECAFGTSPCDVRYFCSKSSLLTTGAGTHLSEVTLSPVHSYEAHLGISSRHLNSFPRHLHREGQRRQGTQLRKRWGEQGCPSGPLCPSFFGVQCFPCPKVWPLASRITCRSFCFFPRLPTKRVLFQ